MPRIRSTPDVKLSIVEDRIKSITIPLAYTNGRLQQHRSQLGYNVESLSNRGKAVRHSANSVLVSDLPPQVKAALKVIYQWAVQDADTNGLFGAGTDEGDI